MKYLSVKEIAKLWGISERSVRNYCAEGKIPDAFLTGKTWNIPESATKPNRKNKHVDKPKTLLDILKYEMANKIKGGIYHKIQVDLTYNSNHIEGSKLTHDQTRYIYETNSIGLDGGSVDVNDVMETVNHFRCIDIVIEKANSELSESFIKKLHFILKTGTKSSLNERFVVGDYKKYPNIVGDMETIKPDEVAQEMKKLINKYNEIKTKDFIDILNFHYYFEKIHPFQDGNGRVGRLIMLKECLKNNIVPFIIDDEIKLFYYRGLKEWENEQGYLLETCLSAQDKFKAYLDYFNIDYVKD
ncbi:Fic family protein [bacterium]|nr:Fic family protein [bacterium]